MNPARGIRPQSTTGDCIQWERAILLLNMSGLLINPDNATHQLLMELLFVEFDCHENHRHSRERGVIATNCLNNDECAHTQTHVRQLIVVIVSSRSSSECWAAAAAVGYLDVCQCHPNDRYFHLINAFDQTLSPWPPSLFSLFIYFFLYINRLWQQIVAMFFLRCSQLLGNTRNDGWSFYFFFCSITGEFERGNRLLFLRSKLLCRIRS